MTTNLLNPLYMSSPGATLQWGALPGSAASLAIGNLAQHYAHPCLVVTPDVMTSNRLYHELQFFNPHVPVLLFPDWETLPYDHFSPHHDIISERLYTLYRLPRLTQGIVLVAINTLLKKLPPREHIENNSFIFKQGEHVDSHALQQRLVHQGYKNVHQVVHHGEFAVRGSLIDVYPIGSYLPYRLDLFTNEIDSIRSFDPETQCSLTSVTQVRLLPAAEFPLNEAAIDQFRQNWRGEFKGNPRNCTIYNDISRSFSAAGIEYYLSLFFVNLATLFDYLPAATQIVQTANLATSIDTYWSEVETRYEQYRYDSTRPLVAPSHWLTSLTEFNRLTTPFPGITLTLKKFELTSLIAHKNMQAPLLALAEFLKTTSSRVLICAESNGHQETLLAKLQTMQIKPAIYCDWQSFLHDDTPLGMVVAGLEQGLQLKEANLTIITEIQLYNQPISRRNTRKPNPYDIGSIISNLTELKIGSPVVHIDHGIGLYQGLQTIKVGDLVSEYLMIEYADNNKLYVPVNNLHLITHYGGVGAAQVTLSSLGNKQWLAQREKAARRAYDIAAELLDINARRHTKLGFKFAPPDEHYYAFADAFPFEETPDQRSAIANVIHDMQQAHPMDRLVCGDVGFGKTEVAMRAAFLAIQSNKQVAILVPTTLLAQQHYETFTNRFANTGANIGLLSRFRTTAQQQELLTKIASGTIDIVIGTHKLIQHNINFKNLGLIIIDEEHCFGVQQKERLKALRAEVDMLTLTATPIPRTLNMALANVRNLSIIATPPAKRLSIKTFLYEYHENIICEAISREIGHGGQVYFVHNNIATISLRAREIQQLLPTATVRIGHGQMHKHELELVMTDFYHQRFNVLVCTTIIETGIDIPSVNTIIIERADKFGLAQLHQLRGRVGRSYHQAYAYLLIPSKQLVTADTEKRLNAITTIDELGAGFTLASHDLEIRGAGEFLGEEQTGHIQTIGLTLYMEFLQRAVASLKSGKQLDFKHPLLRSNEIDLGITALIPDDYVYDVHTRLILYKRIANAVNNDTLDELALEISDRFGSLPEAVKNLFMITKIKLSAQALGIDKIRLTNQFGYLQFSKQPTIDVKQLMQLIQQQPHLYKLEGAEQLRFALADSTPAKRIDIVTALINRLKGDAHALV